MKYKPIGQFDPLFDTNMIFANNIVSNKISNVYDDYIAYWNQHKHILNDDLVKQIDYQISNNYKLTICYFSRLFTYIIGGDDDKCEAYSLVPVVKYRGYLGFNVMLYLIFNHVNPVGMNVNPLPVHRNRFKNSGSLTYKHDVLHVESIIDLKRNHTQLYVLYQQCYYNIRYMDDISLAKSFIMILFILLHEIDYDNEGFIFNFDRFMEETPDVDEYVTRKTVRQFYEFITSISDQYEFDDDVKDMVNDIWRGFVY